MTNTTPRALRFLQVTATDDDDDNFSDGSDEVRYKTHARDGGTKSVWCFSPVPFLLFFFFFLFERGRGGGGGACSTYS